MKYKIGQKVKVIASTFGRQYSDKTNLIGNICIVSNYDSLDNTYGLYTHFGECYFNESDLAPATKDWDTLEVGDILVDTDGDTKKVLGICGLLIFTSDFNNYNRPNGYHTKEGLIARCYTIKQDEPEVTEMTMEEVCKKLGKNIRIKK